MENFGSSFVIIPAKILTEILEELKEIKNISLIGKQDDELGQYVTEEQAKKLLGRKTTWFWNLRKSRKLSFRKIGSKTYYHRTDIEALLRNGGEEV